MPQLVHVEKKNEDQPFDSEVFLFPWIVWCLSHRNQDTTTGD